MHDLLIHNDNTPFIKSFKSSIEFSDSSDIDNYISKDIIPKVKAKNPNIIFIKDKLSSNYLELYGLRLAYHIRFEERLKLLPIVILSDLDGFTLNRFEPMAKILFTHNVFVIENNKKAFDDFKKKNIKPFNEDEYKRKFLDLINVEPPENSTNHSIANEWAIDRWAEFLKVKSEVIKENREKISSMLYFKYLQAKYPLVTTKTLGYKRTKSSGKILYIDDEWDKGWSDIFTQYFSKNPQIEFETFEYLYKDKNKFSMMSDMKTKVQSSNPDVIILDLRLTHTDHQNKNIEMLSGIKIAKMIKEINAGIQIIMLSASSKNTILEKLYEHDILGYIKKEHPQDNDQNVKERVAKLADLVDDGLEKKYLKEIWKIQEDITIDNPKIQIEVKSIFEIVNSDMENRFIYAMFAIFKVLELIIDEYIEERYINSERNAYWKKSEELIENRYTKRNDTSKNKIRVILDDKLQLRDRAIHDQIESIVKSRNNTIHPKKGKVEEITANQIVDWFKMLQTILEKMSLK